ncbi:MAG: hypothetical protein HOH19_01030, partial [Kordiimonadaceae bacterium]|nr:hypothetical protein [Kordiimonadaceae bacterium]
DLLWDTAIRIESGGVSDIEKTLLSQLDELNLILGQKKSFSDIRLQIRETDKVFRQYSRAIRKSYSNLYSLDIDFKSLRKLYSYILTFSDKEKYYNASLVVDVLRKGVVFNDELVLSQGGLGNYFALSEGRKIIENLISIQKSLLANSYNEQMKKSQNIKRKQKYSSQKNTQESIKLQSKVGDAVKLLGEKISFTGMSSEFLIQDASNLIEAILTNMKTDEYSRVAQSQTELIIVMSNLKRILNKPATRSPELQNIIQEINGQPTS